MTVLKDRQCAECGGPFTPQHKGGRYCTATCKDRFMNRRKKRGAQLYDFVMSKRYDRINENDARSLIDNLARAARDADKHERDGRPSWIPFEEAKKAVPLAFGQGGDNR
jgi:hypothetical protein